MRKLFFTLSMILFSAGICIAQIDKRLTGLDTFVNKVLKDWKAPGITIAVVEKNKIVFTGGFGFRNLEKKLPVTENTLFAIGSCTKAFTASILGMLEKEGKVNLDKPVRTYLPELKFFNDYLNDHVTLRDMMTHRTGLPRHDLSWYGSPATRAELLKRIQYLEPSAELREKYQYNNFMFMAQGLVIEKVTGKSWEQNIRERIFQPLGMNRTVVSISELEKNEDASLAFSLKSDSIITTIPYRNIDAVGPAGSINSSAKDMANWLITWINNGKFAGKEIIPPSFVSQAISVQMATGGGTPGPENSDIHGGGYGLGWGISSYRGHYRVEHSGGIDGFITTTCFFPSDSIGIFVVCDQGGPGSAVRNFIADRMLKLPYRNWRNYLLERDKKALEASRSVPNSDSIGRKFNTKPSHPLADYKGVYSNEGYGEIEIAYQKDSLIAKFNAFKMNLKHFHYDQFNAVSFDEDLPPLKFSFQLDGRGEIEKLSVPLEGGVKDIEFKKVISTIDVSRNQLMPYVGEYEIAGLSISISIKGEKTLVMNVAGQPEYELIPIKTDEFNLKGLEGYSARFEFNDKKEVIGLYAIQPNGTFRASRKK